MSIENYYESFFTFINSIIAYCPIKLEMYKMNLKNLNRIDI